MARAQDPESVRLDSLATTRPPIARTEKTAELIARTIIQEIVSRNLPPGSMLAGEADMLEQYQVGRASLREALRILEVQGLITIRPGPRGGPVVGQVSGREFGRMATLHFQVARATLGELVEARKILEPGMAALAAQRRDPETLAYLRHVVDQGNQLSRSEPAAYARATSEFHAAISGAAGNKILRLFDLALKDIYTTRVIGTVFPPNRRDKILADHTAIFRAIERGDAAKAERLMRGHMEEFTAFIVSQHPGLLDEIVDWR